MAVHTVRTPTEFEERLARYLFERSEESRAVRVANASRYGLGAAVWTRDAARGEQLARELDVGSVFINGLVKSDPRLPFGGVKLSGYGRELSEYGLKEFVDIKTVWVA